MSSAGVLPRGWTAVLVRTWRQTRDEQVPMVAAGVAFFFVAAIFPGIAALVWLVELFTEGSRLGSLFPFLSGLIPENATHVLRDQVQRSAGSGHAPYRGLAIPIVGFLMLLWSANMGMKGLFKGLNMVYERTERRGYLALTALTLVFTLGSIAFLLVAVGIVVLLPHILAAVGMKREVDAILTVLRWPALFLVVAGALALVYRFAPNREPKPRPWLVWASGAAAIAWVAAAAGFSWLVAHFGSFGASYGQLGAVVSLLFWLWISVIIVLTGAELEAALERVLGP